MHFTLTSYSTSRMSSELDCTIMVHHTTLHSVFLYGDLMMLGWFVSAVWAWLFYQTQLLQPKTGTIQYTHVCLAKESYIPVSTWGEIDDFVDFH